MESGRHSMFRSWGSDSTPVGVTSQHAPSSHNVHGSPIRESTVGTGDEAASQPSPSVSTSSWQTTLSSAHHHSVIAAAMSDASSLTSWAAEILADACATDDPEERVALLAVGACAWCGTRLLSGRCDVADRWTCVCLCAHLLLHRCSQRQAGSRTGFKQVFRQGHACARQGACGTGASACSSVGLHALPAVLSLSVSHLASPRLTSPQLALPCLALHSRFP